MSKNPRFVLIWKNTWLPWEVFVSDERKRFKKSSLRNCMPKIICGIVVQNCWEVSHTPNGTGTVYPSGAPEFTPVFSGVRVTPSLVLCVYFVHLSFFFCPSIYGFYSLFGYFKHVLILLQWKPGGDWQFLSQILQIFIYSNRAQITYSQRFRIRLASNFNKEID